MFAVPLVYQFNGWFAFIIIYNDVNFGYTK